MVDIALALTRAPIGVVDAGGAATTAPTMGLPAMPMIFDALPSALCDIARPSSAHAFPGDGMACDVDGLSGRGQDAV